MPLSRRHLLTAGASVWAGPTVGAERLTVGLAPFLSPVALLATFRRLREHLGQALSCTVDTYTARDFKTLFENTRRGDYDMALLPAHIGLIALQDWGFMPLAGTLASTSTLLLVRRDSRVQRATDLQGGRIGGLDALSIVSASALAWLGTQGLVPGRDLVFVPQTSVNSGLYALDRGDIDALAIASTQLLSLPPDTPRSERVLKEVGDVTGPVFVARPGPSSATIARWQAAFLAFEPDRTAPLTASNTPMRRLAVADLVPLAPYTALARTLLVSPSGR